MNAVETTRATTWVSGLKATQVGQANIYSVLKACLLGHIRCRIVGGRTLEFAREDVETWREGLCDDEETVTAAVTAERVAS